MRNIFILIVAVIMTSVSVGCGGTSWSKQAKIDKEAYTLGETHARVVIDLFPDTAAICDRLLDVRTRESDFRKRFGNTTADSYVAGFEEYIREHDQSLASRLF